MIHIMMYVTQSNWDAMCDDWKSYRHDDMVEASWPNVARATTEPCDAWIAACYKDIETELLEYDFEPERLEGERELKAFNSWQAQVTFTGSYWDYPHGAIHPTAEGHFTVDGSTYATLKQAEEHLFYQVVLPKLDIPIEPPVFTWSVEEREQPSGAVYHVHTCLVGDETAAVMIVRHLEDDLA